MSSHTLISSVRILALCFPPPSPYHPYYYCPAKVNRERWVGDGLCSVSEIKPIAGEQIN